VDVQALKSFDVLGLMRTMEGGEYVCGISLMPERGGIKTSTIGIQETICEGSVERELRGCAVKMKKAGPTDTLFCLRAAQKLYAAMPLKS
jgi:hypothetical protein